MISHGRGTAPGDLEDVPERRRPIAGPPAVRVVHRALDVVRLPARQAHHREPVARQPHVGADFDSVVGAEVAGALVLKRCGMAAAGDLGGLQVVDRDRSRPRRSAAGHPLARCSERGSSGPVAGAVEVRRRQVVSEGQVEELPVVIAAEHLHAREQLVLRRELVAPVLVALHVRIQLVHRVRAPKFRVPLADLVELHPTRRG